MRYCCLVRGAGHDKFCALNRDSIRNSFVPDAGSHRPAANERRRASFWYESPLRVFSMMPLAHSGVMLAIQLYLAFHYTYYAGLLHDAFYITTFVNTVPRVARFIIDADNLSGSPFLLALRYTCLINANSNFFGAARMCDESSSGATSEPASRVSSHFRSIT